LLFSVSRRKVTHNFRENIISNGKFIAKDIIFLRKALFCGEESIVLQGGEPHSSPVRGGRRHRVYLHKDVPIGSGKMDAWI